MKAYEILEIRKIMNNLLLGEAFDRFCLVQAQITGAVSYTIDGRINTEFYQNIDDNNSAGMVSETSGIGDYISWKEIKPHVLAVIKGKLLPLKFKIVLTLTHEDIVKVMNNGGLGDGNDDISSLNITISYERDYADPETIGATSTTETEEISNTRQRMICTSGFCRRSFTMDKSPEIYWDEVMMNFIQKLENQ